MKNIVDRRKILQGIVVENSSIMRNWLVKVLDDIKYKEHETHFEYFEDYGNALLYLEERTDIAIILVNKDIDGHNSGLDFIKKIRKQSKNELVRFMIFVNNPTEAEDTKVMVHYDVESIICLNDESASSIKRQLLSGLRVYSDLAKINLMKDNVKKVISHSEKIKQTESVYSFYEQAVSNFKSIFDDDLDGFLTHQIGNKQVLVFGLGKYHQFVGYSVEEIGLKSIEELKASPQYFCYSHPDFIHNGCVVIDNINKYPPEDVEMIEIYTRHISLIYNTMSLKQEMYEMQREIIMTLGEVIETKSHETAGHVKRVAEFSSIFAKYLNMTHNEIEMLKLFAPMHDIGKIGIEEAILNKPSELTKKEFDIIKTHTLIGWKILAKSQKKSFQLAATIALEHHERWDGNGYPYGKKGDEINLASRIVAASDIIDALSHCRVYKEAWSFDEVKLYIFDERGKALDPVLVDIFREHLDEFKEVLTKFPDE